MAGTWRYRRGDHDVTTTPFDSLAPTQRTKAEKSAQLVAKATGDDQVVSPGSEPCAVRRWRDLYVRPVWLLVIRSNTRAGRNLFRAMSGLARYPTG
jgi:hypothetical protein